MKQYRVFIEYNSEGKQIEEDGVIVIEETSAFVNDKKKIIDFDNLTEAIDWIKKNGKFACDERITITYHGF